MNPMKPLSRLTVLALTGALTVAGCNAPSAQETAPAVADTADTLTNTAPVDAPADADATNETAPAANAVPATDAAADTKNAPDPSYRVVDAAEGGGPPAYVAAMKKAQMAPPPASMKVPGQITVVMQTTKGPITLELNGKEAPLHVKSFAYLAGKGFFDGTVFHRHAALLGGDQGYIIQGGDPLTKDPANAEYYGQGGPGYNIPRERNALTHQKLVIAAARSSDPDSAGSQFYITQAPVLFLDEGEGYTVFGKVVAGADAALKLTQGDKVQKVTVEPAKTAKK